MMEKKDYLRLNEFYSILRDHESLLMAGLNSFIRDAFDKHGNVFEYKCKTHNSWDDKIAEGTFDAMNDLPTTITVWVDDDGGHEVYPVCVRQKETSFGYKYIEVSGWDWYENCWLDDAVVHSDAMEGIADFINAVLEQEQEEINI